MVHNFGRSGSFVRIGTYLSIILEPVIVVVVPVDNSDSDEEKWSIEIKKKGHRVAAVADTYPPDSRANIVT